MSDSAVTVKQAVRITGSSESTIRRMIKAGKIPAEKAFRGKKTIILIDRNKLLQAFSVAAISEVGAGSSVKRHASDCYSDRFQTSSHGGTIDILKEQLSEREDRIRSLETQTHEQRAEIRRLNEEIKGLLRASISHEPRGIMGYLSSWLR